MGSTGLGGTPWTALTIRSPAVLTNKERHPPCANSPVFKTILTERPRAAVFLRLFRNNLLPFDPDLESIEDDDDYDDEVDDDDDDVDEVLVGITGVEDSSSQEDHSEGRGNCNCTECSDSE